MPEKVTRKAGFEVCGWLLCQVERSPLLSQSRPAPNMLEIVTYYSFRISQNFHPLFCCA